MRRPRLEPEHTEAESEGVTLPVLEPDDVREDVDWIYVVSPDWDDEGTPNVNAD